MDEELLPTGVMPITVVPTSSGNLNFPTSSPPPPPSMSSPSSMYPNLEQEIMAEDIRTPSMMVMRQESVGEEVNGQVRMSPHQSHAPVTTPTNSGSYLSSSVNYSGGNVTFHSSPHRSKTNRKKSRKLTLTQVCSDGSPGKIHHQGSESNHHQQQNEHPRRE